MMLLLNLIYVSDEVRTTTMVTKATPGSSSVRCVTVLLPPCAPPLDGNGNGGGSRRGWREKNLRQMYGVILQLRPLRSITKRRGCSWSITKRRGRSWSITKLALWRSRLGIFAITFLGGGVYCANPGCSTRCKNYKYRRDPVLK